MRRQALTLAAWFVVLVGFVALAPRASLQQRTGDPPRRRAAARATLPVNTRSLIPAGRSGRIRIRSPATSGARRVVCSRNPPIASISPIAAS